MNKEEFESKIRFTEKPDALGRIWVAASIVIQSEISIDSNCPNIAEEIKHVKERLKYKLSRYVYEDHRTEFFKLVDDLYRCNPMECERFRQIVDKMREAAARW